MQRYFLEVAYKGTAFSGFQSQHNAHTIQAEIEKALQTIFKEKFILTGSSRTDAGVHALQNFFHFDAEKIFSSKDVYNINAIISADVVVKKIMCVAADVHCRFDAISREYKYYIYNKKDPFLKDVAYYYPFKLNEALLHETAALLITNTDYQAFSKKRTQVKTFICHVQHAQWLHENNCLVFHIKANRFLRGMVKGLVGTMLKVARGIIDMQTFQNILHNEASLKADFSPPSHGLFLTAVNYRDTIFAF